MIVLKHTDGRTFESRKASLIIGRDSTADVAFAEDDSDLISRLHARIQFRGGWYELIDEGSANGTYLNGVRVKSALPLREGDIIQLGHEIGPRMEVGFRYDRTRYQLQFQQRVSPLIWILGAVLLLGMMFFLVLAVVLLAI